MKAKDLAAKMKMGNEEYQSSTTRALVGQKKALTAED